MKIAMNVEGPLDTVVMVMNRKEAQDLATACTTVTDKECKPLKKNSRAWKIAHQIAEETPCW